MVSIEVTTDLTDGGSLIRAFIEGRRLSFDEDGVATIKVKGGIEHPLQWFVEAAPSTQYSISIIKPDTVNFKYSATIDAGKRDAGVFWFTVQEGQ